MVFGYEKDDFGHINVVELEAVMEGVNLIMKWGLEIIIVITESETVAGWIHLTLSGEKKVKTECAAELLVKRS